MKPFSTRSARVQGRSETPFYPAFAHHEPVGCAVTATMPFDDMFEDMTEIDDLGDAGPQLTARDGWAYSDFS